MLRIIRVRGGLLKASPVLGVGVCLVFFLAACGSAAQPTPTKAAPTATQAAAETKKLNGDVVNFSVNPGDWEGAFGWITFRLHQGFFNGDEVYFIRSDTSDASFAQANKLVHVPILATALNVAPSLGEPAAENIYLFTKGAAGQAPVFSTAPGQRDYTPVFRAHNVSWKGTPRVLNSIAAIETAKAAGEITVEDTNIVVNYPVVKWSGGEMAVDTELKEYLGKGQLVKPVDGEKMEVTFKLHECYPGIRYIITDTSMEDMAKGMNVVYAPKGEALREVGAVSGIFVLGNGIKGTGPMGFQPSVVETVPGDPTWSPYWDHFTFLWNQGPQAKLLTTARDVKDHENTGNLKSFNGVPDSHPRGFEVNCPTPILSPNTFTPGS